MLRPEKLRSCWNRKKILETVPQLKPPQATGYASAKTCCFITAIIGVALLSGCGGGSSNSSVTPPTSNGGGGAKGAATFFGMHINSPTTPWPNVPVAGLRMWDDRAAWALVNTAPGVYDWSTFDIWLAAAKNKADVLYDFGRTPSWAQCSVTNPSCGLVDPLVTCAYSQTGGEGGPGQCLPPNDLDNLGNGTNQHWIDWVTAVATHSVKSSTSHIKYYEIWNEANLTRFWDGNYAQLARMAQDARCIIIGTSCGNSQSTYTKTGIDPSAMLLTPAFVGSDTVNLIDAFAAYLPLAGQYADIIAFHGYVGHNPPEQIVTVHSNLLGVLAAQSQQTKQLFNTEASWGTANPLTDADQQAAWLSRYILLQVSLGINRFYWYSWDVPGVELWSSSTGTTLAGTAYREMNTWVSGATANGPCTAQGSVWSCGFTRASGYQAMAVWDTSQSCSNGVCSSSSFSAPSQFTQYLDVTGKSFPITGGVVPIGLKPILLETGNIP